MCSPLPENVRPRRRVLARGEADTAACVAEPLPHPLPLEERGTEAGRETKGYARLLPPSLAMGRGVGDEAAQAMRRVVDGSKTWILFVSTVRVILSPTRTMASGVMRAVMPLVSAASVTSAPDILR